MKNRTSNSNYHLLFHLSLTLFYPEPLCLYIGYQQIKASSLFFNKTYRKIPKHSKVRGHTFFFHRPLLFVFYMGVTTQDCHFGECARSEIFSLCQNYAHMYAIYIYIYIKPFLYPGISSGLLSS